MPLDLLLCDKLHLTRYLMIYGKPTEDFWYGQNYWSIFSGRKICKNYVTFLSVFMVTWSQNKTSKSRGKSIQMKSTINRVIGLSLLFWKYIYFTTNNIYNLNKEDISFLLLYFKVFPTFHKTFIVNCYLAFKWQKQNQ